MVKEIFDGRNISFVIGFFSILVWTARVVFAKDPFLMLHENNISAASPGNPFGLIIAGLFFAILIISAVTDVISRFIYNRRLRQVRRETPSPPVNVALPGPVRRREFGNPDYTLELSLDSDGPQRRPSGTDDSRIMRIDLRCVKEIVEEVVADLVLRSEPFSDGSRDERVEQKKGGQGI